MKCELFKILARHVILLIQNIASITLFQQDNATSLTANNIAFINDWPAKTPDLNPIENLWDNLNQRV